MFPALRQFTTIMLLSLSFWSSGVFLIRFMSGYHLWSGWPEIALFAASPLIAATCIDAVRRILGLTKDTFMPTIVLITGLVAALHGLVLSISPSLYGDPTYLLAGASWLVWFCGSVLVPAVVLENKSTLETSA